MRPLWLHFLLLLLYLFLVFVIFRLIDMYIWYQHGIASTHVVDPLMLSVRQLKQLLETRGISYTGYVEKKELAELVEASANVLHGEVDELGKERLISPPTPSHFTGGPHFYEEVEDTKDSVWIVQVVPPQAEPLLDDYSWRVVCSHVAPFAIRTGIFDCNLDRRLCSSKGWNQPLLVLALPKGSRAKDKVILRMFTSSKPQLILDWVRDQLSIRVRKIGSLDDLEENWLSKSNNKTSMNEPNGVKVLLLSHLLHPPVFLSALSIKFTGRIKFGVFSAKKQDVEYIQKKLKIKELKLPTYLIITPEQKVIIYGQRKSEHFNFFSMYTFLRAVQPEMNDVFLWSLVTVNMLVFLRIFQISMQLWWKKIAHCVWTIVTYNLWLFSLWLVIIATSRFPVVSFLIDKSLVLVRYLSLTDIGSLVRADWQVFSHNPYYILFSFIIFALIVRHFLNIHFPIEIEVERENDRPWWEVLPVDSYWINFFFQPMATLTRPIPPTEIELEEGIEMLIERLAVPNLWLHPVIPLEYIKDLPVWKFRGWNSGVENTKDLTSMKQCAAVGSPEDIACMMDCQYPSGEPHNSSHCRNCLKEKLKFRHFQSCSFVHNKSLNESVESTKCTSFLKVYNEQNGRLSCNSNSVVHNTDSTCSDSDRRLTTAHKIGCLSTNKSISSEDSGDEGLPSGMLPTTECAICLESYTYETLLCGLPCGHSYHQPCIMVWLQRDNHHCPVCRWPAYKSRHLHRE